MVCLVSDQVDAAVSKVAESCFRVDCGAATDEALKISGDVSLSDSARWALILAGGDGTRLQGLTKIICGDDRPKQFCPIVGKQTLLQQAMARAERSVPPEQTIVALTRTHARYYEPDLMNSQCRRLIQPCNRGTAPAIIAALLQIARIDPAAIVAILPSDHYYSNETAFTMALESAFEASIRRAGSVILLGAQAARPETEFGWIELGSQEGDHLFRVQTFQEKPTKQDAERLFARGALWNTFVVVGSVNALLEISFRALPDLVVTLSREFEGNANGTTTHIPECIYEGMPPADFSRRVLSLNAQKLLALRLQSMEWHDLGQPDRVISVVRTQQKKQPEWISTWQAARMNGISAGLRKAV